MPPPQIELGLFISWPKNMTIKFNNFLLHHDKLTCHNLVWISLFRDVTGPGKCTLFFHSRNFFNLKFFETDRIKDLLSIWSIHGQLLFWWIFMSQHNSMDSPNIGQIQLGLSMQIEWHYETENTPLLQITYFSFSAMRYSTDQTN